MIFVLTNMALLILFNNYLIRNEPIKDIIKSDIIIALFFFAGMAISKVIKHIRR